MRNVAGLSLAIGTVRELFGQRRDRLRQFVADGCGRPQILNRVAAFGDGLIRPIERAVECLEAFAGCAGSRSRAL